MDRIVEGIGQLKRDSEQRALADKTRTKVEASLDVEREARHVAETARLAMAKDLEYERRLRVAAEEELDELKRRLRDGDEKGSHHLAELQLAKFLGKQQEAAVQEAQTETSKAEEQAKEEARKLRFMSERCDVLEAEVSQLVESVQKEKSARRAADDNELHARHERESELDRRLQAESRVEELQYQRDATEAELRALEQKVALLEAGVSGVSHQRVEIAGMDRHKLERANLALEEELEIRRKQQATREEGWAKERSLLERQLRDREAATEQLQENDKQLRRLLADQAAEVSKAHQDQHQREKERSLLSLEVERFKAEGSARSSAVQDLSYTLEEANAECDALRSKVRRMESRNNELEGDVEALQSELRTLKRLSMVNRAGGHGSSVSPPARRKEAPDQKPPGVQSSPPRSRQPAQLQDSPTRKLSSVRNTNNTGPAAKATGSVQAGRRRKPPVNKS